MSGASGATSIQSLEQSIVQEFDVSNDSQVPQEVITAGISVVARAVKNQQTTYKDVLTTFGLLMQGFKPDDEKNIDLGNQNPHSGNPVPPVPPVPPHVGQPNDNGNSVSSYFEPSDPSEAGNQAINDKCCCWLIAWVLLGMLCLGLLFSCLKFVGLPCFPQHYEQMYFDYITPIVKAAVFYKKKYLSDPANITPEPFIVNEDSDYFE